MYHVQRKINKKAWFFFLDAFVQTTDLSSSCGKSKLKKEIRRVN